MWLGNGANVATPAQKPDLPVQQDILFNDLYQEVRCAAPSAQVIFFKGIYILHKITFKSQI